MNRKLIVFMQLSLVPIFTHLPGATCIHQITDALRSQAEFHALCRDRGTQGTALYVGTIFTGSRSCDFPALSFMTHPAVFH